MLAAIFLHIRIIFFLLAHNGGLNLEYHENVTFSELLVFDRFLLFYNSDVLDSSIWSDQQHESASLKLYLNKWIGQRKNVKERGTPLPWFCFSRKGGHLFFGSASPELLKRNILIQNPFVGKKKKKQQTSMFTRFRKWTKSRSHLGSIYLATN